ncbi:MAG: DUF368 domain-containing protein [Oscillospiraceae bacterium]|nr:DUF368 domain-containing protein [Oscillospiraceae bacterium]
MLKAIRTVINGLAFGITETVPGVSGGTIAVILGFYDDLIEAIGSFQKNIRKHLRFLLLFFIGAACGLLAFSRVMSYLLDHYSFPMILFFIGLVVGIIPYMYRNGKERGRGYRPFETVLILIPALALPVMSHLKRVYAVNPVDAAADISVPFMVFLFFAGILAAAAMVLPGVSGSFFLLLLGVYQPVMDSVKDVSAVFTNIGLLPDIGKVLLPLGAGIIIGCITMSKMIGILLKSYYRQVNLVLLGLLLGSVYALFNEPGVYQSDFSVSLVTAGIVTFLLGGLLSFVLGRKRFL